MELSNITACFLDHSGLYLPLALKLSETYKRVIYYDPCEKAFPEIGPSIIGDGWEKLERVKEFWPQKKEIDLFVFPDSQGQGLQKELQDQGFPVWGARAAQELEQDRELFNDILARVGLKVAPHVVIEGLPELANHLKDKTDKYIKISYFRGTMETTHWRSWDDDENLIHKWYLKFGRAGRYVRFIVCDAIETDLEIGGDTYNVLGQWPELMMHGDEYKDKGYLGALTPREEMPDQLKEVMEAFGPILGKRGMRGFWSMEVRVKDDEFYFIDATPRGPLPAMGSQMEIYANLPEIIWAGANGELVNPEPSAQYSAECVLTMKGDKDTESSVEVPESLSQWMKLGGSYLCDGRVCFPPDGSGQEEIGWLVAIGDTPKETILTMLDQAKELPDGVSANTESLANLLKEIDSAEKQGIEFGQHETPEPAIVVENA